MTRRCPRLICQSHWPILSLLLLNQPERRANVETVLSRLSSGRITVPDYQRDADQWDSRKESLFIESLLNNLTVPAFFFSQVENSSKIEVVDGQQRLTTIQKYSTDQFALSTDDSMVYLTPQAVQYRGKKFSELSEKLTSIFNDYPLTIIYLPQKIELGVKLEIFRRINEGGTPLTAQDIRLAYYSESSSVTVIRLAGLQGNSSAAIRMRQSALARGVADPWANGGSSTPIGAIGGKVRRKRGGRFRRKCFCGS
jgi:hypothetical protein